MQVPCINVEMVRPMLEHARGVHLTGWSMPVAIGLLISVSVLVALCAKHNRPKMPQNPDMENSSSSKPAAQKSPMRIVTSLSNKAIHHPSKHRRIDGGFDDPHHIEEEDQAIRAKEEGGFGEGGLWQKSILMGERCRPPEFSGAIYYDSRGNRLSEMPRSPRAGPLPSFSSLELEDIVQ